MTWTIRFPDGAAISGATAATALAAWRRKQWTPRDVAGWREELAKRAYIVSGFVVDPDVSAPRFLEQLEHAGLIDLERTT